MGNIELTKLEDGSFNISKTGVSKMSIADVERQITRKQFEITDLVFQQAEEKNRFDTDQVKRETEFAKHQKEDSDRKGKELKDLQDLKDKMEALSK